MAYAKNKIIQLWRPVKKHHKSDRLTIFFMWINTRPL